MNAHGERRRRMVTPWREDPAPVGKVVEVWYGVAIILATWTGAEWRAVDGTPLRGVTHWRLRG